MAIEKQMEPSDLDIETTDSRYYYHTSSGEADLGGGICFAVKRKKGEYASTCTITRKKGPQRPLSWEEQKNDKTIFIFAA